MKAANQWITYRTRFLVQAKQLSTSLTFTDALGRRHSGCKGDYLVESSDGSFRIAPRQIFEDVYVPLRTDGSLEHTEIQEQGKDLRLQAAQRSQALPLNMPIRQIGTLQTTHSTMEKRRFSAASAPLRQQGL